MDPNPVKHFGTMIKRIRANVEPALTHLGFQYLDKNIPRGPGLVVPSINFGRPGQLLNIRFERNDGRLISELLDDSKESTTIAEVVLKPVRFTKDIVPAIDEFTRSILDFFNNRAAP